MISTIEHSVAGVQQNFRRLLLVVWMLVVQVLKMFPLNSPAPNNVMFSDIRHNAWHVFE
jgi:hypothetical protein